MFLSKLVLNPRDRQARCDLARPYEMHRTLWRAFPDGDPGRVLFRVDTDRGGNTFVLVLSDLAPAWERLPDRGEQYLRVGPAVKEFEPMFAIGQRLRFRLRANPTKKVGTPTKEERQAGKRDNGQRLALFREDDQVTWLVHKGEQGGFRIPGEWKKADDGRNVPNFRVDAISEGWVRCGKDGHTEGRFFAVRFDGILEVTDPALFPQTIANGIGSAKGFGFGMLSVAPAEC